MSMATVNFIGRDEGQRNEYQRNGGTLTPGIESSHASQGRRGLKEIARSCPVGAVEPL